MLNMRQSWLLIGSRVNLYATEQSVIQQECAAVERPPAMGPFLQLSTYVLFGGFLGLFVPAVEGTKPRSSSVSSQANAILSRNNVTLLALLDIFRRKVKRLVEDFFCKLRN